ncbi:MAG: hypothetical protein WEB06_03620 [Actinomycetota bacterium]
MAVLVSLAVLRAAPARAASTFYVSVSGADANAGTLGAPWRTVGKGLASLFPGDTLLVRGGTYVERITSVVYRPATAGNPITVAAYPGEVPIVKGVLQIRGSNYWTFDGINAMWDPATGTPSDPLVKIMHGVGWTFKNAEIWGARSYAGLFVGSTVVGQPSGWRIAGNCIHDTYAAHPPFLDHNLYIGLKVEDQPGPGIVERNVMFNASNGENIKVGGGSEGGAEDVIIRNNTLYNASQNVMVVGATTRTTFERNLMGKSTGKWWYPNLRGQDVTGANNIAFDNAGFLAERFLKSTNSPKPIIDGGGNLFGVDPKFNALGCTAFRPQLSGLKMYGRWAPSGDPLSGDWDGDGTETGGFRRGNVWRFNNGFDASPEIEFAFGRTTDRPIVGDWNGDGIATPGVVRGNLWYLNNGFDAIADISIAYGKTTDRPVVGDWNDDGTDTPGLVRGNVWYLNNGTDNIADVSFAYGQPTDVAVVGDWNGDGADSPGVLRGNTWYLNDGFGPYAAITFAFGAATDVHVVGDWDGDGHTTVGVVRGSSWFLRNTNAAGAHDITFSDEAWL